MNSCTVRVELHNATYDDYESLHFAMAQKGFSRLITADSGVIYHLPTAEYDISSNLSRAQVLDLAKAAANTTGKTFAVLVTEATGRTWVGLQKK